MAARSRESGQTKETRATKQNEQTKETTTTKQTKEILKKVWFLLPGGGLRVSFKISSIYFKITLIGGDKLF